MSELKLCVNCLHCRASGSSGDPLTYDCSNADVRKSSLVTGDLYPMVPCETARMENMFLCGPEASCFSPAYGAVS